MTTALKNLGTGFRNIKQDFRKAAKIWIAFGAGSGGFLSGATKFDEICNEKDHEYTNPTFEIPIRAIYQTSRVAAHAGWGAAIGGIAAATAPVSISGYIYWLQEQKKKT